MSEKHLDMITEQLQSTSIERARYWFEQYRCASGWEMRLIRAIRDLNAERVPPQRELH